MPNAMMHDPAKSETDMLGALADAVDDMKVRKNNTPADQWPETIRREGKMSADAVRSAAKEVAQRIVDTAKATMVRAQMDVEQAGAHANEIVSRAEAVAISIEGNAETDAKVSEQMAATIALILPPIEEKSVVNSGGGGGAGGDVSISSIKGTAPWMAPKAER